MQIRNKLISSLTKSVGFCSLGILGSCNHQTEEVTAPNIIFIMSDDHAWQALSAYNERLAEIAPTPNIDRIAREGMRFDRCLVTNSICGPSRATILTGKYSHMNGYAANIFLVGDFDGTQQTFPKLLQQAGYQTAMIGKWHLGSDPTGFDHWDILPGQGHYYNPAFINEEGTYEEYGYVTDIITDKTIKWLKGRKDRTEPFMLMMHHKAPHREWEPGPKYLDHFAGVTFPEPHNLFSNYADKGTAAIEQDMSIEHTMQIDADLKMWPPDESGRVYQRTLGRMDDEQRQLWLQTYDPIREEFERLGLKGKDLVRWKYQRYMYDYLATIVSVDESVGRILDYLEESGINENTLVIYTSDQGFYLGEHGWFDKRFMYEESYRTPLVIKWPGQIKPGSVNNDIVSNLDFAQTFLDVAGASDPGDMQGRSMLPLLRGEDVDDWRKAHYYHYYEFPGFHSVKRHYGIATERYKLMHFYYDIDEWEMYDLVSDPHEMQNIYDKPSYASVREDLHIRLDELRLKYLETDDHSFQLLPVQKQ
jgi:arylsulfatase A-like enzyme